MNLSVIIPTRGAQPRLEILLAALARQEPPAADWEIVLAGNEESAELRAAADCWQTRLPRLRLVFAGARGVNRARNAGIAAARGEILVFLDDDCIPKSARHLAFVADLHARHPLATAIGGFYESAARANACSRAYNRISRLWLESARHSGARARNLVGGNVSYKRSRIGESLRFNSDIAFGGAETEFHARLAMAGHILLLSDNIPVEHQAKLRLPGFLRRALLQGYRSRLIDLELGPAARFSTYASLAKTRLPWLDRLFRMAFLAGSEWCRISTYEHRSAHRALELLRHCGRALVLRIRSSLLLRELYYCQRVLWDLNSNGSSSPADQKITK